MGLGTTPRPNHITWDYRAGYRANRRYVALYHLVSPEVQATAAWKSAADTEWTRKLRPYFRDHLRLVCERYTRAG